MTYVVHPVYPYSVSHKEEIDSKVYSYLVRNFRDIMLYIRVSTRNFLYIIRIILSPRYWEFSPMKLGKKEPFSHWDWGRYSAPKTQSENHWN